MAETRTPYFELATYSDDNDETLTREDWVETIDEIELRAAYDDGGTGAALPVDHLKPGRYFRQSVTDGYALHRRSASGWEWVGGSVATIRQRLRGAASGDIVLSTDIAGAAATATLTAGGELGTNGLVRSLAGGSFGANLDTDLSVVATTGRLHVRTRADNDRAVVARAHAGTAGNLYTAIETGGSATWWIDSSGRMRSTVPAGLGAASPTTGVPLAIAPSDGDTVALRLTGKITGAIPGLRVLRDASDTDDILAVQPDRIRIGRTTPAWAGVVELRGDTVELFGDTTVSGDFTGDNGYFDRLSSYGGYVIPVVSSLAAITSPVTDQWALLSTDRIVYRYTGSVWAPAFVAGAGTSAATRHEARYVKTATQLVASTANAFTLVRFETADYACDDVTPSGTGNTTFTLNRAGLWTIVANGGYLGNPGAGRRTLYIMDTEGPTGKIYGGDSNWPQADAASALNVAVKRRFPAGQVIKVTTLQDSGNGINMDYARENTHVSFTWERG